MVNEAICSWEIEPTPSAVLWMAIFSHERTFPPESLIFPFHVESPLHWQGVAQDVGRHLAFLSVEFRGVPPWLQELILHEKAKGELLFADIKEGWVPHIQNGLHNLRLPCRPFYLLKGALAGEAAVVAGSGPSLDVVKWPKNPPFLIAAGTALNKISIEPNLGAIVDPYVTYTPPFPKTPLVFPPRAKGRISFTGEALLAEESPGSFFMTDFPFFEGGWNAGTFAVAVAIYLGCDPIYLVGMEGDRSPDLIMGTSWINSRQGVSIEKTLHIPSVERKKELPLERLPLIDGAKIEKTFQEEKRERWLNPLFALYAPLFRRSGTDLALHKAIFFEEMEKKI